MKNNYTHSEKQPRLFLLAFIVTLLFLSSALPRMHAENIISSGTTMKVLAGTTVTSMEGLTIKSGATLDNAGTVILKKNLTNQNPAANSLGNGTLICSGAAAQTISGNNIIQNLTINNAAGVVNSGETRVNGVLTLTSGLLTLGATNLTMGTGSSVAGAPSATAMVVASGTGEVRRLFSGIGSFTFPVGDNTGTAEYSPVTLNFTAGTFPANSYAAVNLVDAQYPGGPAGSYLTRYWNVRNSGITTFTCSPTFQYVPADVVGTENLIYCMRITPSSVDYFNVANTATDQLTATNISAFGTFTGYQILTAKTLNLTCLLQGLYNGSGTMRKAQNEFGDQFAGSTADQISIELHNSGSYESIAFSLNNVNLSTAGTASASVPGLFSGSYYVTVKHRNSIETTTASPVSFAGGAISYNFTNLATKAYGNNMKLMSGGYWAFFAGDVTQDDIVDSSDMISVDNASSSFAVGYIPEDANGDGLVDSTDMILVDNNSSDFVTAITPP